MRLHLLIRLRLLLQQAQLVLRLGLLLFHQVHFVVVNGVLVEVLKRPVVASADLVFLQLLLLFILCHGVHLIPVQLPPVIVFCWILHRVDYRFSTSRIALPVF